MIELITLVIRLMSEVVNLVKNTAQSPMEGFTKFLRRWPVLILLAIFVLVAWGRDRVHFLSPQDVETFKNIDAAEEVVTKSNIRFFRYLVNDYRQRLRTDFGDIKQKSSLTIGLNPFERISLTMIKDYVVSEVLATSSSPVWWDSAFGKIYEQANKTLLEHNPNVRIIRIFRYRNTGEFASLKKHMLDQCEAGIDVRTALITGEVSADYIVVDNSYAGVLALTNDRNPTFSFDQGDVQNIKDKIGETPAKKFCNAGIGG